MVILTHFFNKIIITIRLLIILISLDVPVPCFKPGVCSMCGVTDSITVVPSKKSIVVTTFEGLNLFITAYEFFL